MAEHFGSEFGSCQGAIVSELSLQIFLGDIVTHCDFYLHFPDCYDHVDHIFPSDTEWSRTRVGRYRASQLGYYLVHATTPGLCATEIVLVLNVL